jgi:hypothetical protein
MQRTVVPCDAADALPRALAALQHAAKDVCRC